MAECPGDAQMKRRRTYRGILGNQDQRREYWRRKKAESRLQAAITDQLMNQRKTA